MQPPQEPVVPQPSLLLMNTNGRDPRDMYIFCPAYLEQLDKNRGYRRKTMKKRPVLLGSATATSSSFVNAAETAAALAAATTTTTNTTTRLDPVTPLDHVLHRLGVSDDMKDDVLRRRPLYRSDWTDAFRAKRKIIPAILFLYFSCLAPAVSFGTIASQITSGSMGIVEFLLSAGVSGMLYSILCGQPMTFIAPTGLTLAFISGLFRFCTIRNLPFFPVYAWVGIWTSIFFVYLGLAGCSQWIRFCTRFTDEVFNALLSLNFISEAVRSLRSNFQNANDPLNLTMPFVSLVMALTTYFATKAAATFESGKYFTQKVRTAVKDFGPVTIFIVMSLLNQQSWLNKFSVPTLSVASTFQLAGGRKFWVDLAAVSNIVKLGCALPAVLLTSLFFMDQNISVRVVNNPDNKLKKGSAYNLDMVALGIITGLVSLVGLPWMCGATVQSLNHVKAMTETRFNEETGEPEIVDVVETRFTGFFVHAMIAGTLGLLPLLGYVPIPVVSGVFLFLGRKLMSGNSFLQRIRDTLVQETRLPEDHPIRFIGRKKTILFTAIQIACLWGLWTFKQNSATAIFFPSVIGFLMFIRSFILPKMFTENELIDLGDPTPS
jgi:HCO3- transporter family